MEGLITDLRILKWEIIGNWGQLAHEGAHKGGRGCCGHGNEPLGSIKDGYF
jgi:hypothetical protein